MDIFVSLVAVAAAFSCLIMLVAAGWKDRLRKRVKERVRAESKRPDDAG